MFGCNLELFQSDVDLCFLPAEKDALLPNLVHVCGFVKARACAIWRLQIELRVCSVAAPESIWRLQNQSDLEVKSESDAIVR